MFLEISSLRNIPIIPLIKYIYGSPPKEHSGSLRNFSRSSTQLFLTAILSSVPQCAFILRHAPSGRNMLLLHLCLLKLASSLRPS